MERPLMTRNGEVVPDSHVRLLHVNKLGQKVPFAIYLYAHLWKDLGLGD